LGLAMVHLLEEEGFLFGRFAVGPDRLA
jgi:hypothetical protein